MYTVLTIPTTITVTTFDQATMVDRTVPSHLLSLLPSLEDSCTENDWWLLIPHRVKSTVLTMVHRVLCGLRPIMFPDTSPVTTVPLVPTSNDTRLILQNASCRVSPWAFPVMFLPLVPSWIDPTSL